MGDREPILSVLDETLAVRRIDKESAKLNDTNTAHDDQDKGHPKEFRIQVNGVAKVVSSDDLSYQDVVLLAYPTPPDANTTFSISYEKAREPHEGDLVPGQSVEIKEGTEFDVTPTGKS